MAAPATTDVDDFEKLDEETKKEVERTVGIFKAAKVTRVPVISVLHPFAKRNPYTSKTYRDVLSIPLEGLSSKGIVSAVQSVLPNELITRVDKDADAAAVIGAAPLPAALLFTNKDESSPLAKALALKFHGRMSFFEVAEGNALADEIGVTFVPAVFAATKEGAENKWARYGGKLKAPPMIEFFEGYAAEGAPADDGGDGDDGVAADEVAAEASSEDDLASFVEYNVEGIGALKIMLGDELEDSADGADSDDGTHEAPSPMLSFAMLLKAVNEECYEQAKRWQFAVVATEGRVPGAFFDGSDEEVLALYKSALREGDLKFHSETDCVSAGFISDAEGAITPYVGEITSKAIMRAAKNEIPEEIVPVLDTEQLGMWSGSVPGDVAPILYLSNKVCSPVMRAAVRRAWRSPERRSPPRPRTRAPAR